MSHIFIQIATFLCIRFVWGVNFYHYREGVYGGLPFALNPNSRWKRTFTSKDHLVEKRLPQAPFVVGVAVRFV